MDKEAVMRRILAATDFSTRSHRALRRAGLLARKRDAGLTLVHVVEDDQPRSLIELERREASKFLDEQIHSLAELRGVRCNFLLAGGAAFDGILQTARISSADLIVMGSHRKQLLRDVFIGTTVERVIRGGTYPVLMVNKAVDHPYERVLAATDMSEVSARAIRIGEDFGMTDNANLILVHAFLAPTTTKTTLADASAGAINAYVDEERLRTNADLSAFIEANRFSAEKWSRHVEPGTPFEVISRVVQEKMSDLLILGTHGRTGIEKFFLGSVAEEALRALDVDILVVPQSTSAE
jgi:universal stress protein E